MIRKVNKAFFSQKFSLEILPVYGQLKQSWGVLAHPEMWYIIFFVFLVLFPLHSITNMSNQLKMFLKKPRWRMLLVHHCNIIYNILKIELYYKGVISQAVSFHFFVWGALWIGWMEWLAESKSNILLSVLLKTYN